MGKRKSTGTRLRFEVFKRDSFTCQYCGRKAPDVVLELDHVNPVSKGGDNDILNLITSCWECNSGKSDRVLSDDSVLSKQRQQLAELNERRQQLEMMIRWRDELKGIEEVKLGEVVKAYNACIPGWSLNETGIQTVRRWMREFPFDILLDSIDVARSKVAIGQDGKATSESCTDFRDYVPRVANCKTRDRKDPGMSELLRLRGYMRTFMSFRDWECLDILKEGRRYGMSADEMKSIANRSGTWSRFRNAIYEAMGM